jgi:phenylalanyl-tRNA synthetase alpha chain
MLEEKILAFKDEVFTKIKEVLSSTDLFDLKVNYLGRKSEFNAILKGLKDLGEEERRKIGQLANVVKKEIEEQFAKAEKDLRAKSFDHKAEKIDVTIPGKKMERGHLHILSQVQSEIEDIFASMGFTVTEGPEVELEHYNFDALNIPKDHPARDMQDTFWLKSEDKKERILLRTQTSAAQVRFMEKNVPPFRVIVPGRCFRREATDTTHEHTFHQFEALVVGDDINVAHLKYIAQEFFSKYFKKEVKVRLRPSYFPFTEPSFEFDISCTVCEGKGCSACRHGKWLEMGGAGMVNQNVFVSAGYPRGKYQGFAWGFGLERLAMMKYKIDDIRLFHSGDLRFIKQF